jgi:hypothetical protein
MVLTAMTLATAVIGSIVALWMRTKSRDINTMGLRPAVSAAVHVFSRACAPTTSLLEFKLGGFLLISFLPYMVYVFVDGLRTMYEYSMILIFHQWDD